MLNVYYISFLSSLISIALLIEYGIMTVVNLIKWLMLPSKNNRGDPQENTSPPTSCEPVFYRAISQDLETRIRLYMSANFCTRFWIES